jgi:hypothetical protein
MNVEVKIQSDVLCDKDFKEKRMKRELLVGTGLWTILFLSCFARYFILPEY